MLQLQRSKINSGSLTVVGNEFYQPGDVVYVKSKGLLYYVKDYLTLYLMVKALQLL